MATKDFIAKAEAKIDAPASKVWDALVNPAVIKKYMFGAEVVSDWKKGSNITWKGEWEGKKYEDKGKILEIQPEKRLIYTHYSPLSGEADKPENYHTVTVELKPGANKTAVSLLQDKNTTEKAQKESEKNWKMMFSELKKVVEKK